MRHGLTPSATFSARPFPKARRPAEYWKPVQIGGITNCPTRAVEANWPLLEAALLAAGQGSKRSLAAAIATVAIETASTFAPVREAYWIYDKDPAAAYAYYSDSSRHAVYQGGPEFHGRGLIQITHAYNYIPILGKLPPLRTQYHDWADQLLQVGPAVKAFATYWQARDIGAIADREDWIAVRRSVQGGSDGLYRLVTIVKALLA